MQRLGIAQALINRPTVLLLDEPVSSLDPIGRRDVLAVIERLGAEEGIGAGTSVFMSTHILADVERVCDTVGVINHGRMVAVEEVSTLKERYGSEIADGEAFRRRVLAAIVEERLDLESLQSRASLEEAFVELIGV